MQGIEHSWLISLATRWWVSNVSKEGDDKIFHEQKLDNENIQKYMPDS